MTDRQLDCALRAHAKELISLADALSTPEVARRRLNRPAARVTAGAIEYHALELLNLATVLIKAADHVTTL